MSEQKMTAEQRMTAILAQIPRGWEARGGDRPVPFVDAVNACKEHAAAAVAEMKRERDEARAALKLALDGVHCACIVFEAACPSCVGRRVLRAADGGEVRS